MGTRIKAQRQASVTQATSKSTAVECGADSGIITMHNASLAATTSVSFTVNNGYVDANDVVLACIASGATTNSYAMLVDAVAAGSFRIHLRNLTAGGLGEAVVINFAVVKAG